MDAKSQRREESLKFNIDQLNKSLAEGGDDLLFELCIDTHQHSQSMEAYVSQSDLGLIVEYQNFILPETSWSRAYLLQAKRLHPSPAGYDEKASFKSVDARQHAQLERFAEQFGQDSFRYILYCPPTSNLAKTARTKVRALHTHNLATPLFDFAAGLTLFDH